MNSIKIIIKLLLIILFLGCLLKMPYGYFQLVRFIGMISFIWLVYKDKERESNFLSIFWICSAALINPFFKVALGRAIWNAVDIVWVIILLFTIILDVKNREK